MKLEEKLKIFKGVTRDYQKYLEHVKEIDEKLEMLQTRTEEVQPVDSEEEAVRSSFEERPAIEVIEQKTILEKKKQCYLDLIEWIRDVIDSFESASIKALIWMTYIQKKSLSSIADEYLISKDNLYKIRRKHLNRILTNDVMARLEEIRDALDSVKS